MPSLEQLLANVQGVKDLPEEATRKSVDHGHADVFRGAVKQEQALVKRLNGLVQAYRKGRITKDVALSGAEEAVNKRQALLTDIALRRAKRALRKDISTLAPEMTERLGKIREETLKSFSQVLADVQPE
jgi:hypothetical protein